MTEILFQSQVYYIQSAINKWDKQHSDNQEIKQSFCLPLSHSCDCGEI